MLAVTVPAIGDPPAAKNFGAHLSGGQEVPARETAAQGQAIFQLNADETAISYKVIVANINNVVASHIHFAAAGTNGSVVAFLASPSDPGGGPQQRDTWAGDDHCGQTWWGHLQGSASPRCGSPDESRHDLRQRAHKRRR